MPAGTLIDYRFIWRCTRQIECFLILGSGASTHVVIKGGSGGRRTLGRSDSVVHASVAAQSSRTGGDHARTRRQSSRRKGVAVEWGCVPVGLNRLPYRPDRGRLGVSQQRGDDPARSPGRKRPDGGGEHAGIDSQHLYRRRRYRR